VSAQPAKFTFDLDLGRRQEKNRLLTESAMARLIAETRDAGFKEGYAAGEQSDTAKAARQLATAANDLGDRVAAMAAEIDDARKLTMAEAVDLAATIAKKLAAALIEHQPMAEIEELIAECLASIDRAPHLVIRCNVQLADAVRDAAAARVQTSGFAGRLVVMGDPEIVPGDCRIEWVDGGLVRDQASLMRQIDQRIAAFLAAHGISNGGTTAGETE
jgi:flagellar assembly protein FliH